MDMHIQINENEISYKHYYIYICSYFEHSSKLSEPRVNKLICIKFQKYYITNINKIKCV